MSKTFSLEQISRSGNLDAILILREHKSDSVERLMEIKSINPKLKQKEMAKKVVFSSSSSKSYTNDRKMQKPYKLYNPTKNQKKTSSDLRRPQLTSKDANEVHKDVPQKVKTQNRLTVGDRSNNPNHGSIIIEQPFSSRTTG